MSHLSLDFGNLKNFISEKDLDLISPNIRSCSEFLKKGQGPGSEFLGWKTPGKQKLVLDQIEEVANSLRDQCEVFIVVGIGGSYIGAQAGLTFLKPFFPNGGSVSCFLELYSAVHNFSRVFHSVFLDLMECKDIFLK